MTHRVKIIEKSSKQTLYFFLNLIEVKKKSYLILLFTNINTGQKEQDSVKCDCVSSLTCCSTVSLSSIRLRAPPAGAAILRFSAHPDICRGCCCSTLAQVLTDHRCQISLIGFKLKLSTKKCSIMFIKRDFWNSLLPYFLCNYLTNRETGLFDGDKQALEIITSHGHDK